MSEKDEKCHSCGDSMRGRLWVPTDKGPLCSSCRGRQTSEPEVDYYRTRLREMRHKLGPLVHTAESISIEPGDVEAERDKAQILGGLRELSQMAAECLARPRSNGPDWDELERLRGDLSSRIIDLQIANKEIAQLRDRVARMEAAAARPLGPNLVDAKLGPNAVAARPHEPATCESCRFWSRAPEELRKNLRTAWGHTPDEVGFCRRYAQGRSSPGFPMTAPDEMCGEFEPKGDGQ